MLIGIDAGGTSTRAVVVDSTGRCLGIGAGGGGNPRALGAERAARGIRGAVESAVRAAGARGAGARDADGGGRGADDDGPAARCGGQVAGRPAGGVAVLAMAGASTVAEPEAVTSAVRDASGVERVEVVSDLVAMFGSGTPQPDGYVLVGGTGAAALRIEQRRVAATADGLGWLLGDAGSGFWIGHQVVRAALAALDGVGPPTALACLMLRELGLRGGGERTARGRLSAVETALETFYSGAPVDLAQYAALAFEAAAVGDGPSECGARGADPVATALLRAAGEHLTATLRAVRRDGIDGPVVIGGSIARRLPGLADAVAATIPAGSAGVRLVTDGLLGAAVLALRVAGVVVDDEVFTQAQRTLAALRG